MQQTWRMLLRIAGFQCAVGFFGALLLLALNQTQAASAFLFGVILVMIAALAAAGLGLRRAGSPLDSLSKVLGASFSKWLLILAAVYLALARWQFAALPLMLGVIAAQFSAIVVGLRQPKF